MATYRRHYQYRDVAGFEEEPIMARANQVVGFTQLPDGGQQFTIGGKTRTTYPDQYSLAVQTEAMRFGFKQRFSDKAAIPRDLKTGKPATAEEKRNAIWALIDWYETGTDKWEMPRVGGGGGGRSEASYILEAVANVQQVTVEVMQERVETMAEKRRITPDAYLKQVALQSEAVRTEIARIKYGENAGAESYLDELSGDAEAEEDENEGEGENT